MRILITNDDGINSTGLTKLASRLEKEHEVWIVAPEKEMSGSSHAITINRPIRIKKLGERKYHCLGTPADCVILGERHIIREKIDVVISGINIGSNLGTDILFSGTVAGARQAALSGIPAIAASVMTVDKSFDFIPAAEYISDYLPELIVHSNCDHFVNINFPEKIKTPVTTDITFPSKRIYKDDIPSFDGPDGSTYCFIGGEIPTTVEEEGSDFWAVSKQHISLSPIVIHPVNHEIEEAYKDIFVNRKVQIYE